MRYLTTGDVSELTCIPMNTLDRWCAKGLIEGVQVAEGRGRHRRFSLAQAVALRYAAEWRAWGASAKMLSQMIPDLCKLTDEDLATAFAQGRTHFHEQPYGKLMKPLPGKNPFDKLVNYKRVYDLVLKWIRATERKRREQPARRGRRRGLTIGGSKT